MPVKSATHFYTSLKDVLASVVINYTLDIVQVVVDNLRKCVLDGIRWIRGHIIDSQRDLRSCLSWEINQVLTLHRLPSKIARKRRKGQGPSGNDQSLTTKRSSLETLGFGHCWKVTTSVSQMEFAKDNLECSEDRKGSGRTLSC